MPIPKPYHTTETAVRVSEAYWFDCPENRRKIYRISRWYNGDMAHSRPRPLDVLIMDSDGLGCVGLVEAKDPHFEAILLGSKPLEEAA